MHQRVWGQLTFDTDDYMGRIARDIKRKEEEIGAELGFFYHIVELDAIPQEINAALGSLVYNFPAGNLVLPHLAMFAFATTKDAHSWRNYHQGLRPITLKPSSRQC